MHENRFPPELRWSTHLDDPAVSCPLDCCRGWTGREWLNLTANQRIAVRWEGASMRMAAHRRYGPKAIPVRPVRVGPEPPEPATVPLPDWWPPF